MTEARPYESQSQGVPAGVSQTPDDLLTDPHLENRGFFIEYDHPEVGHVRLPKIPLRLSYFDHVEYTRSPLFGEHTEYVAKEILGLSTKEIASLTEQKILG